MGVLVLLGLLVGVKCYRIDRPYNGLHSWEDASSAWIARCHVNYGLGYTRGIATMEVGESPSESPKHYVNHPQLSPLLDGAWMAVLGVNVWALRVEQLVMTAAGLALLMKILRHLMSERTALLAGLFFVMFPLTGYFGLGTRGWVYVPALWAFWRYLHLVGALSVAKRGRAWSLVELAVCLFLMIQLCWTGVFFAFVIGLHYVWGRLRRKWKLSWGMLGVLVVAPLASMVVNLLVMCAGYGWDVDRVVGLYKWRAAASEKKVFVWRDWLSRFWEFSVTDFTVPVLVLTLAYCVYLVVGRIVLWTRGPTDRGRSMAGKLPEAVSHLWFILGSAVVFILVFRGLVWEHQYWLWPFSGFVAVSAASMAMLVCGGVGRCDASRVGACGVGCGGGGVWVLLLAGVDGLS